MRQRPDLSIFTIGSSGDKIRDKMFIDRIRILQIDLVSSCNARCPACFRQDSSGRLQPHFPQNTHLELETLAKLLHDPESEHIKTIFLCGSYGDPMASPRIIETFDLIKRINPGITVHMHTNGSLGKRETWLELAHRMNGRGNFIKFSIDGLEDTNHLYRRGVSWNQVMENATTFIEAGGRAVWKFVVFEHNKHQIDKARSLSKAMGFARFETTSNYAPEIEPYLGGAEQLREKISEPTSFVPDRLSREELDRTHIDCDYKKESTIFLDFEGYLWPCCWIAGWKYSPHALFRNKHKSFFSQISGDKHDFNSLKSYSLKEILAHPWFANGLTESWATPLSNQLGHTHPLCIEKCGKCKPAPY